MYNAHTTFKKDVTFKIGNAVYQIGGVVPEKLDSTLYCHPFDMDSEKKIGEQCRPFSARTLLKSISLGDAHILETNHSGVATPMITDKQFRKAEMWKKYIDLLVDVSGNKNLTAERNIQTAMDSFDWGEYQQTPPCQSTCQAKVKTYRESELDVRSLIDWGNLSDKGQSRLPERVELLLLQHLTDFYLVRKSEKELSLNKIYSTFKQNLLAEQAINPKDYPYLPTRQTFYNRANAIHPLTKAEAQKSKAEIKKLKKKLRQQFFCNGILERVEMDAVYVSIGLLDDDRKTYLGTAVIMVSIDTFSRSILGYSICVGEKASESADLAIECLKHSVMPKENPNHPMHGLMATVTTDATTATKGNVYKRFAHGLGMIPIVTRVGEAWSKPFIERFFLTLRLDFLSDLPGYLGSKLYRNSNHLNPEDKLERHAQLTVSEFIARFEDYITDVYHESGHYGLNGRAPIDVWNDQYSNNPLAVCIPSMDNTSMKLFGKVVTDRKLYLDGYIKLENEIYRSDELKELALSGVKSVTVYYSDIDGETVSVKHNNKLYLAERRVTQHKPLCNQRASINVARENLFGHLPAKDKKYTNQGKGIGKPQPVKPKKGLENLSDTPTTNINNNDYVDTTQDNAKDAFDEAHTNMAQKAGHKNTLDNFPDSAPPEKEEITQLVRGGAL